MDKKQNSLSPLRVCAVLACERAGVRGGRVCASAPLRRVRARIANNSKERKSLGGRRERKGNIVFIASRFPKWIWCKRSVRVTSVLAFPVQRQRNQGLNVASSAKDVSSPHSQSLVIKRNQYVDNL